MQLRIYAAIVLFLGSYLPLSVILLAQNIRYDFWGRPFCNLIDWDGCIAPFRQPILSLALVGLCSACFIFTLAVLGKIRTRRKIEISESKHIPTDLMNYVLPYVVSFMGLEYDNLGKFIGFVVFLLWIFIITYSSDRIVMNPVLAVFGWKLYEVKYNSPAGTAISTAMALSRVPLDPGQDFKVNAVQDVLIVK